ncbi:MAG: hypothetical protein JSS82_17840 [Bacteroidetes bacterium]|nr:hypothetical protein [Bacteroidota bacterium]
MSCKKLLSILMLLVLCTHTAFADDDDDEEGGKHKKARRSELGLSYPMTNTSFFYRYREFGYGQFGTSYDTSFSFKLKSKGGFGLTVGGFIPIIPAHAKTSMLAFNITGSFNIITWDLGSVADNAFNDGSLFYDDALVTSSTMIMSFLLGFDYKYGADAALDKGQRFCFTMGGGVAPTMTLTQFGGIPAGASMKVKPYAKVELGMMAGICMKLRVLYTIGDLDYFSYHDKGSTYDESLSLTDKSNFAVALVLMPMSFKWEKKDKWDR